MGKETISGKDIMAAMDKARATILKDSLTLFFELKDKREEQAKLFSGLNYKEIK